MDFQNVKPVHMDIQVLGTGCKKCQALDKATREAVSEAGLDAVVSKVEDYKEIMKMGVMSTPALAINGKVVLSGKVPTTKELIQLLTQNQ